MLRLNFALQVFPKIFNSFVRNASADRGFDQVKTNTKNGIEEIAEMIPIEKRSLSLGQVLNKFEKVCKIYLLF